MPAAPVRCVIYAAKSTEDVRGSIGTQLLDCRRAIAARGDRQVVAEFTDEGASAYSQSRGMGLAGAMAKAADIASSDGAAELWAQHSDRLARGDGKRAQHVVELALCAIKADVTVRAVQDADTFRDLLYATVMGHRNFEDSKRKGAATSAGIRRAAIRGEYGRAIPDGYLRRVELDALGNVTKRMDIDPDRAPLLQLIFSRALAGLLPRMIAHEVNTAGWRTVSTARSPRSVPFSANRIRDILHNPRYAALATYMGEVVGTGQWPGYIGADEHALLMAGHHKRGPTARPREPFLLHRLAVCALCGSRMYTLTHKTRRGTLYRRYACSRHQLSEGCSAPRMDMALVDALFVENLGNFLPVCESAEDDDQDLVEVGGGLTQLALRAPLFTALKRQIREELAQGEEDAADRLVEELVERRWRLGLEERASVPPRVRSPQPLSGSVNAELRALRQWSEDALEGRVKSPAKETERLNLVLRSWFRRVVLRYEAGALTITAQPRGDALGASAADLHAAAPRAYVARRVVGYNRRTWSHTQIEEAFRSWTAEHGRPPYHREWTHVADEHPCASSVITRYRNWSNALRAAGLSPSPPRPSRQTWTRARIEEAFRRWTAEHGGPPRHGEWIHAADGRPCASSVLRRYGSWRNALEAAGLSTPRRARREKGKSSEHTRGEALTGPREA